MLNVVVKKPDWIKVKLPPVEEIRKIQEIMDNLNLHTVCQEASCPNLGECFGKGTATFMILGDYCTRNCRFCSVKKGQPLLPDSKEPKRVAEAVKKLGLVHVVVTSVTRDDLDDNGAKHYAETIRAIKILNPGTTVEVLIPDLQGEEKHLKIILDANPDILNHNIETVPRLYQTVRPDANYERSLYILEKSKQIRPDILTKTGIMVGLGEEREEVIAIVKRLVDIDCKILTIGQYLQPTKDYLPVKEYLKPEIFDWYKRIAISMGMPYVESGPFIRSSYNAKNAMKALLKSK